jgi:hypothetical protein
MTTRKNSKNQNTKSLSRGKSRSAMSGGHLRQPVRANSQSMRISPAFAVERTPNGVFLGLRMFNVFGNRIPGSRSRYSIELLDHRGSTRTCAIDVGPVRLISTFVGIEFVLLSFALIVDDDQVYRAARRLARPIVPDALRMRQSKDQLRRLCSIRLGVLRPRTLRGRRAMSKRA